LKLKFEISYNQLGVTLPLLSGEEANDPKSNQIFYYDLQKEKI